MYSVPDLRILFPTSFSDACFQTGRAIAQLADRCHISLTIVHVTRPGGSTAAAYRELESFLGEADHYDHCRRILIESDCAPAAIADIASQSRFDLVMTPASDRLGLHSLLAPSFRGRLLGRFKTPMWTSGATVPAGRFRHRIRNVACLVDLDYDPSSHLTLASAFAARFDARLHLLHVVPSISEGLLLSALEGDRPLHPEVARAQILRLAPSRPGVDLDVAIGERAGDLRRMLARCEADLMFVHQRQAARGVVFSRFARDLDRLPCPVVCLSDRDAELDRWTFEWQQRTDTVGVENELVLAS